MLRLTRSCALLPALALILSTACGRDTANRTPDSPAGPATQASDRTTATPTVAPSDNRRPAGRWDGGVLTVRLAARNGVWHPEGPDGPGLPVAAFAEEGRLPQNPGPLVRVPAGTEVRVSVRNSLAKPLTVYGLGQVRGLAADSLVVAPGEVRETSFRATVPGTWYYAGRTTRAPVFGRSQEDSQLNGAIVVDPAGASRPADDRIFLVSWWFTLDSTSASGLGRATLAINGLSWPHTERIDAAQGDSLRWRWINLTGLDHPMHLHGFYFRVDGTGDGSGWTGYAPERRRQAVTELLRPGGTMALAWSPDRPGNWIFHCHFVGHISHLVSLAPARGMSHQMAGLVLGIRVAPRGPAPAPAENPRRLRLLIRSKPNVFGRHPGYAYVLGGSAEESDTTALPRRSPTLVLERGRPVAVTIVNRSEAPAAVHWHGIELESFPDGVPGWSTDGKSVLPGIEHGDSLTVRFTPPRAGTFMYHSHMDEQEQIASGLYGPIVVVEPGTHLDPETDRVLLFSDAGPTENVIRGPFPPALLNGRRNPGPMTLRAGTTYRFRLINIRTDYSVALALLDAGGKPAAKGEVEWRVVAKDGADLPASQVSVEPARLTFAAGEIYDVEFTPRAKGNLVLQFGPGRSGPPGVPVAPPTSVQVSVR